MKQSQTGRHGVEGPGVARIGQVLGITLIIVLLFWMVMGATPTMASSLASKVSYGSLPAGSIVVAFLKGLKATQSNFRPPFWKCAAEGCLTHKGLTTNATP